jgi:hypothetical protein
LGDPHDKILQQSEEINTVNDNKGAVFLTIYGYCYPLSPKKLQEEYFTQDLTLARQAGSLPV